MTKQTNNVGQIVELKIGDIPVTINKRGEFTATVGGKFLIRPSLAALKKEVNRIAEGSIEPFVAFKESRYSRSDKLDKITVVMVSKTSSRMQYECVEPLCFITDTGEEIRSIIPDSTEAHTAWQSYVDYRNEKHRIENEMDEKLSHLYDAIPRLKAQDLKRQEPVSSTTKVVVPVTD